MARVDGEAWTAIIHGLAFPTNEESLRNAFSKFGEILQTKVKIAVFGDSVGHVTFRLKKSMIEAIDEMDGSLLQGHVITVNQYHPCGVRGGLECDGDAGGSSGEGGKIGEVYLVASDKSQVSVDYAILADSSPVFRAMMKHGMTESSGIIKMEDFSSNTLQMFVKFLEVTKASRATVRPQKYIYESVFEPGRDQFWRRKPVLDFDEKMIHDLLVLADRYEVQELSRHCEQELRTLQK